MPCDSVITMSVDLSKCGDRVLLKEAVESLGGKLTADNQVFVGGRWYSLADGKLSGDQRFVGQVSDQIKVAYARKSVYASAKKMGWQVQEVAPNKLRVLRRF